jgi:Family of unknown function (DUF5681)
MPKRLNAGGRRSKNSRREDEQASYAVGFGKPPLQSRFAPGRSGNPRGRPKGQLNLETILKNELSRLITIREGDRSRRLKKGAAWVVRTVNGALNNDPKANATLVALLRTFVLGQAEEVAESSITSDDQGLLADYLQRHGGLEDHSRGDTGADPRQPRHRKKKVKDAQ